MNCKTEHTPTPWGVALDTDGFTNIVSPNADGTLELMIAECYGPQDIQKANAAFIVEACNTHSTLLSRLDALRAGLEKIERMWPATTNPNCDDYTRGYAQAVADIVLGTVKPLLEQTK